MSTFELVNHQIRHLLGGIQAQKNSSIQSQQTFQKKIIKGMQKAQASHKKIFQGVAMIKSSLVQLSQNYMGLFKQSNYSGKLIGKLHSDIIGFLQEISQESLSLSKKMESKEESYLPNLKKIKQKYVQCAQSYQHYKQKLQLLKRGVQKQTLANIKPDQHERFQRNKQKLKNAQKQHDEMLSKISKRYFQFNSEGLKDIYYDFVSILSVFGGSMLGITHKLSKYLYQNFGIKQILLAKQFRAQSKAFQKDHSSIQKTGFSDLSKDQANEYRRLFLDYLVQQKQIANYVKTMMDRQMGHIEVPQKICDAFNRKQHVDHKEKQANNFASFINQYNNAHLRHHNHHSKLQQMKEQDPIQACQELIQAQILSEDISRVRQNQSPSKNQLDLSFETQLKKIDSQQNNQKIKKNLQKFNKIPHQNPINKNSSNRMNMKSNQKIHLPHQLQSNIVHTKPSGFQKNQPTVAANQFFNFFQPKKVEEMAKPQRQLTKMHEHPFNFDSLMHPTVKQDKKTYSNIIMNPIQTQHNLNINHNTKHKTTHNEFFQNFDFFTQSVDKLNKKTHNNPANANEIKSAEILNPKLQKTSHNNIDLLNL